MILTTWPAIKGYLHLSRYKILSLGYPVYILPRSGAVYAETDALDKHTGRLMKQAVRVEARKKGLLTPPQKEPST